MQVTWITTFAFVLCSSIPASAKPITPGPRAVKPDQLEFIAPKSSTCKEAPAPGECRTAVEAAPIITHAFQKYNITSLAEHAALISLMAFESDDFKFNRNKVPGVPGQGTRNMQSPDYNALYAESLPDLQKDLAPISGKPEAVLDLILTKDAHDFGSAAWFLATQCSPAVRNALRSGGEDGWRKYITSCVGTTVTEDRREVWERAVEALEGYQEENK